MIPVFPPAAEAVVQPKLTIKLAHGSAVELATKAQLERLIANNDVRRWLFTRTIIVDQTTIPHSDPVLTLHTRHLRDDDLLLSTFVHEQLHWYLARHRAAADAAVAELKAVYHKLPVGFPDGSDGLAANYDHILICFLEYQADRVLMGELRAREVMAFWAFDHYRAIYRLVLDNPHPIAATIRKHGLTVPALG